VRRKLGKFWRLVSGRERCCERTEGRLTIGFVPWWPSTFYQAQLVRDLAALGVDARAQVLSAKTLICLVLGRDCLDVVHVHWPHGAYLHNPWRAFFVVFHLWMYRWLRDNVVWTVHELEFYETRHPRLDRWVVRSLLRLSRALIAHSEHSVEVLRSRYCYRRDIRLLRHPSYVGCYPNEVDKETARAALGIPSDAAVYLFLGYIKPYKGVEELIEAFGGIEDPNSRLIIAGMPMDDAVGRRIAALAREDARIMAHTDFLPDERLQYFLNAADVLAFPFRKMHTSGSVLLGLSYGRPVIVPRLAALPEEVDDSCGILFDPKDPGALRNALLAARNEDLALMGIRARERLRGRTWSEFAANHVRLYHALRSRAADELSSADGSFLSGQDVKLGYHRSRR
jgi:glycosyltransferase involved in cell wall biosynthesis